MGVGYQYSDRNILDYKLWYLPEIDLPLRGPANDFRHGDYFSFLGAAQTFGRLCAHPFPERISQFFGKGFLNFGIAGCGPEYYLKHPEIIRYVNGSKLCVLQLMSGRSGSNAMFDMPKHGGALQFRKGPLKGQKFMAREAYRSLIKHYTCQQVMDTVEHARTVWVKNTRRLMSMIKVPTLLLWFSTRTPHYEFSLEQVDRLLGPFPHLIDAESLMAVVEKAEHYVQVVTNAGRPQLLINRHTAKPEAVFDKARFPGLPDRVRCYNTYYPSPEMHEQAFKDISRYIVKNWPELL
jgi:hypothetical protein